MRDDQRLVHASGSPMRTPKRMLDALRESNREQPDSAIMAELKAIRELLEEIKGIVSEP